MSGRDGNARKYDVVVFGATGYTGQFVAEELHKRAGDGLRWAVAGRVQSKLQAVLTDSGIEAIDMIVANVQDQDSLEAMCAQTSVLIDCVGPYFLYGEPIVKACISQKCNYVDITGETFFMESIEAKYNTLAREAGVYIVSSCGFDSIPNDLGALMVQKSFSGDLAYVDSYVALHGKNLTFNTGTWNSLLYSLKTHSELMKLRKRLSLPTLNFSSFSPKPRRSLFYSDLVKRWCGPFQGADRAVVYRSMRYRQTNNENPPFKFRPYMSFGSFWQAIGTMVFFIPIILLAMTNWGINIMSKHPKLFSGGLAQAPNKKDLENISFSVTLEGYGYSPGSDKSADPDSKITVKVQGRDPGYGATSVMLVQSALTLLREKDSLPSCGGVYTPAAAFGNTNLIQKLNESGDVSFQIL